MAIQNITSILTEGLMSVLNKLIEDALDQFEATDVSDWTIIEIWARAVNDAEAIRAVIDAAQDEFAGQKDEYAEWLRLFSDLLQYGGDTIPTFASNIWKAYLFHLPSASEALWDEYPVIQRSVTRRTERTLPVTWGNSVLAAQGLIGQIEDGLLEMSNVFDNLLRSRDVLYLLEEPETPPPPPIEIPLDPDIFPPAVALETYLNAVNATIAHIDPRGYPRSTRRTVPLNDVYIPLKVIPLDTPNARKQYVRYQVGTCEAVDWPVPWLPLPYQQPGDHPGLSVQEVISEHPLVGILGESGSGKTTLLRQVVSHQVEMLLESGSNRQFETRSGAEPVIHVSHRLPVYADLAEFVDARYSGESLQDFILRQSIEDLTNDEAVASVLSTLIETGQCLILLDGLDQVATEEQRRVAADGVASLTEKWGRVGNHIVVTSRFEGYAEAPLPSSFKIYGMRGLDRSQVGPFMLRWSMALARVRRPTIGDDEVMRQAEIEVMGLVREVSSNPRLFSLVNTPLILRLLVGVFRPGSVISPQRAAIYEMVSDALIREWHLPQTTSDEPQILEQDVIEILGELAYWLQASRPAGLLSESEMHRILGWFWGQTHPSATGEQIEAAVAGFLSHVRMYAGVIAELAPQQYGFVFHGLQEYFAARYLVSSYRLAPERIRAYLHDPRWAEVIQLAIGFTSLRSREDASDLITIGILGRGDEAAQNGPTTSSHEDLLKLNLFFAARVLGRQIEVTPELSERISSELMSLWLDADRDSAGRFHLIFDGARHHLQALDGTAASRHAMSIAREALRSPHEHERAYAAEAVTFWPSHLAEGCDALAENGREAPILVRRAMALSLRRAHTLTRGAYRLLLNLVSDADDEISELAQETLSMNAPVPPDLLSMWIDLIRSDSAMHRRVALRVLSRVGALPSGVIQELLHLLTDTDPDTPRSALQVLAGVVRLPEVAITAICRAATDSEANTPTRVAAIRALSRPIELPSEVLELLIDWTHDPEVIVRTATLEALGSCKNSSRDLIDALLNCLEDRVDSVRATAADMLAKKGLNDPRVPHIFAHAVSDSVYSVRCAVARAMSQFPTPNDELKRAWLTLLSDSEMIVREETLDAITRLDSPGHEIIDYLMSLVSVTDAALGAKAVRALSALRGLSDDALAVLVRALDIHGESSGKAIVESLRAHSPLSDSLLQEVMDLAVDTPSNGNGTQRLRRVGLRALALEILSYNSEATATVRVMMDAAGQSDAPQIQSVALRGLGRSRRIHSGVKDTLMQMLGSGDVAVRASASTALAMLIRTLADPPFAPSEIDRIACTIHNLLDQITPRASWETETRLQNDLLMALRWIVSRSRPAFLRLPAVSEQLASYPE